MAVKITPLLKDALTDLESLQEYFHWQLTATDEYLIKNSEKFKYSLILNKYFLQITTDNQRFKLSEDEQKFINTIIDEYEVIPGEHSKSVNYSLKNTDKYSNYELSPEKGLVGLRKLYERPKILCESALITLLIKYEECIAGIFKALVENYPDYYLADKSITYAEVININSGLEEVKKRFVSKTVEEIMRGPLSDWYKKLEKQKVQFDYSEEDFEDFKKVYYTRNIIVHNQGVVNDTYIKCTRDDNYAVGDHITIDGIYVDKAIELTRRILVGTCFGIKKLAKDREELNRYLFDKGYECLAEKRWVQAKFINRLLLKDSSQDAADLLCEQINYWIAEKSVSGIEAIRKQVETIDVSAMNRQFIIAKYALLNEFESVSRELDLAINTDIPASYIAEWPLFNEYRQSKYYKEFQEKHKDEFKILGYSSNEEKTGLLEEVSKDISSRNSELIERLRASTSFATTHSIIESLNEIKEWSPEEVESLSEIALTNNQVQWILDDKDVYIFYKRILRDLDKETMGECSRRVNDIIKEESISDIGCNIYSQNGGRLEKESF